MPKTFVVLFPLSVGLFDIIRCVNFVMFFFISSPPRIQLKERSSIFFVVFSFFFLSSSLSLSHTYTLFLTHTHTHGETPLKPQRETLSWGDGSCKWHFVYIMRMWKMFFCMAEALIKWDCLYHQLNIFHLQRWGWEAGEGEYFSAFIHLFLCKLWDPCAVWEIKQLFLTLFASQFKGARQLYWIARKSSRLEIYFAVNQIGSIFALWFSWNWFKIPSFISGT